ncbi:MAG: reverse transcriptase domain-containing protein, partial [Lentilitoribacter sp.]
MQQRKLDGWFKPRSYRHFDFPQSFKSAKKIACNPMLVQKHQFLPLVRFVEKRRRYRTDNTNLSIPRSKRATVVSVKEREIRYASHIDSAIYQRYAYLLKEPYDLFLKSAGIDDAVIGYRSGKGSNVDMAAAAFAEIAARGDVTAICSDITDFFPSISHKILKEGLQRVLRVSRLPQDWYAVFRSLTKFSSLDLEELAKVESFNPKKPPFPLVQNINQALKRCRRANVIISNSKKCEIPQGTPLSAVAANISMHRFDEALQAFVVSCGGLYLRYSDDVLLLVPPAMEKKAIVQLERVSLANELSISKEKTEIARFSVASGTQMTD